MPVTASPKPMGKPLAFALCGSGAIGCGRTRAVKLIDYHGKLYAYGTFDLADNQAVNNIAQWDGTQWRALGPSANDGLQEPGIFHAAVGFLRRGSSN